MIRFEVFSKRYGAHLAVAGLTFATRAGEIVALLGPNGSGKTTSLKAAAGLVRPSSGAVRVGEDDLPASDPAARRALSFLPQKVSFPEALTGREVVEFYRRLRGVGAESAEAVLRVAALDGAARRAVGTYSGGMVQRLGLAVAALPDAPLLLLDEPTSSLDAQGLAAFHELAEARRRSGGTVVFSSHQLSDVERLADRVAILVAGRLVAVLSRAELSDRLAERGVLRARLESSPAGLLERVRAAAPGSSLRGDELTVPGPPRARAEALEAVQASGARIRGLTAEEGRLDLLYGDLAGKVA